MKVTEIFRSNIKSVEKLVHFDREIMDAAVKQLRDLNKRLMEGHGITNPQLNGEKVLRFFEQIRKNDSLKLRYSTINNQAVVLLVSYFGSAVADLFRDAAKFALLSKGEPSVTKAEFKFKFQEVLDFSASPEENIGDLLIAKVGITFQDMKSIQREFKKYFDIDIEKDENVNNIIAGHACRHTIAHEGAKVNKRVLNQVSNAAPRSLKPTLKLGETVDFTEQEIAVLADSMREYVAVLEEKVLAYRCGL